MKYIVSSSAFILLIVIVLVSFLIEGKIPMGPDLVRADWLSFWSNMLVYIATFSLGMVAMWQNDRFKKENDEEQKRIRSDSNKAQNRLKEINEKLLLVQRSLTNPVLYLNKDRLKQTFHHANGTKNCSLNFINKGDRDVWEIKINKFVLCDKTGVYEPVMQIEKGYIAKGEDFNIHVNDLELSTNYIGLFDEYKETIRKYYNLRFVQINIGFEMLVSTGLYYDEEIYVLVRVNDDNIGTSIYEENVSIKCNG